MEVMSQVVRAQFPRLRDVAPEVPRRLVMVVEKALAKRPEDRFRSALELHDAFLAACPRDTPPPVAHRELPRRMLIVALLLLGAAVLGLAGYYSARALRRTLHGATPAESAGDTSLGEGQHLL